MIFVFADFTVPLKKFFAKSGHFGQASKSPKPVISPRSRASEIFVSTKSISLIIHAG